MNKKFLIRHVGNMGDMVFIVPPVLYRLKMKHPGCHITFVTSWGYKELTIKGSIKKGLNLMSSGKMFDAGKSEYWWGKRNMSGHSLHLIMTNPHVDQLIHWHDKKTDLSEQICREEGRSFPTWSRQYYEEQKKTGGYDGVYELDFGIGINDDPIKLAYALIGFPEENYSDYKIYFTASDREVAQAVMINLNRPRIVLLEGLSSVTTRGWDPQKVNKLRARIRKDYNTEPIMFGASDIPYYQGRQLSLRENIARLSICDVGVGVMSGALHFAAAAGLPTITLYCDSPLRRTAPAYFLNSYRTNKGKEHRTLLGPSPDQMCLLKSVKPASSLTKREVNKQNFKNWVSPGKQATKSCLSVITVDEVMDMVREMV